jgi:N-methylhydantoinase A/oxoprolinase/acetone carboxylase beta subunit
VRGSVEVEKPKLPHREVVTGSPPVKHTRPVNWGEGFGTTDTDVYEMDDVVNGHTIEGPAVIEAPSTTFAIPPDRRAWIDQNDIFHLENKEA